MIPVLAPPRSCSSLITALLGQHPELYATAELECFPADTLAGCLAFSQRVPAVTTHGLLRSLAQLLCSEQSNSTIGVVYTWLDERQHWSGTELVRWIEAQIAPMRGEAERGQPAVNQLWDDPELPPELVMHAVQLARDLGYS